MKKKWTRLSITLISTTLSILSLSTQAIDRTIVNNALGDAGSKATLDSSTTRATVDGTDIEIDRADTTTNSNPGHDLASQTAAQTQQEGGTYNTPSNN